MALADQTCEWSYVATWSVWKSEWASKSALGLPEFSGATSRRETLFPLTPSFSEVARRHGLISVPACLLCFRHCSGPDGLLVALSCCGPASPATGRGRGIGTRDSVGSAVRTVPAS
jgi:hypothetical protein